MLKNPARKYKLGNTSDTFIRKPEAIIFQNFKHVICFNW